MKQHSKSKQQEIENIVVNYFETVEKIIKNGLNKTIYEVKHKKGNQSYSDYIPVIVKSETKLIVEEIYKLTLDSFKISKKQKISKFIGGLIPNLGGIIPDIGGGIIPSFGGFGDIFSDPIGGIGDLGNTLVDTVGGLGNVFTDFQGNMIGNVAGGISSVGNTVTGTVGGIGGALFEGIGGIFEYLIYGAIALCVLGVIVLIFYCIFKNSDMCAGKEPTDFIGPWSQNFNQPSSSHHRKNSNEAFDSDSD